jgi:hypothetical protein
MKQSNTGSAPEELGHCAWIAFWGKLIVLGLFVVLGAAFASADAAPGDQTCGLMLAIAAIVMAFLLVKRRFDGASPGLGRFLFVDNTMSLLAATVVFTALALAGLFVAADVTYGGLHDAGVALAVVSALAVFLSIKSAFDAQDRRR